MICEIVCDKKEKTKKTKRDQQGENCSASCNDVYYGVSARATIVFLKVVLTLCVFWLWHLRIATVEGQTTAHYIEDTIKNDKLKITKLAQGLPVGGEIEQLDDGTLFSAFKNRVPVTGN